MSQRFKCRKNFIAVLFFVLFCVGVSSLLILDHFLKNRENAMLQMQTEQSAVETDMEETVENQEENGEEQDSRSEIYEKEQDDLWILFDNLKFSRNDSQPRVGYYAMILICYIVLLGPVSYFVLKRLDRMEWMWVYVPVLALLFCGWIMVANRKAAVTEPMVDCVTVLSPEENPVVYLASTSPGKSAYQISFSPEIKDVMVLYLGGEYVLEGDSLYQKDIGYTLSRNKEKLTLSLMPEYAFCRDYFRLEMDQKETGKITVKSQKKNGGLEGILTNTTEYDFPYLLVYYQESYCLCKNVKSGDEITLEDFKWYSIYDPGKENQLEEELSDKQENDDNIRQIFNFAYEKYLMEADKSQLSLIGVLPEVESAVDCQNINLVSKGIFYQYEDGK